MAGDIEKAVANHDELVMTIKRLGDKMNDVGKERQTFMINLDKIRGQIKDFESFLNESRGAHDREMIEMRKDVTQRLDASVTELKELSIDRR